MTSFNTPSIVQIIYCTQELTQVSVAKRFRCGRIFKNHFTAFCCWVYDWQNFENRSTFDADVTKTWLTFLDHHVRYKWVIVIMQSLKQSLLFSMALSLQRSHLVDLRSSQVSFLTQLIFVKFRGIRSYLWKTQKFGPRNKFIARQSLTV